MRDVYALSDYEKELFDARLGGYNDMPPNVEKITESEFLWKWHVSPARRVYVHRQVLLPSVKHAGREIGEQERFCSVSFFVFPDYSGIGWIEHYNGEATRSRIDAHFAEWFKFAWCVHEYETIINRMTYKVSKCRKCGHEYAVDSSG